VVRQVGAVGRHLALVGFMGAGKTSIGREVARLTERPFVDLDEEIVARHGSITDLFRHGEAGFRRLEEEVAAEALAADEPSVVSLGGGAVMSKATRAQLRTRAFTVWVSVDLDVAWNRVRGKDRPLARDYESFSRLFHTRVPVYLEAADAVASGSTDHVLCEALAIKVGRGLFGEVADLVVAADGGRAVVVDERLVELALVPSGCGVHRVPSGETAKTVAVAERLWQELRIGRDGLVLAAGGGSTTDVVGFVAATYLRGVAWVAVPTTLVGQVDAGIGGKTGIDLPTGKNLVGAFHLPAKVVIDPDALATLPDRERRQGMSEVVKAGLLAGRPYWDLPEEEMVRSCAAFKAAVVLSDPYEHGRRAILNLGHTFAHALEAASGYTVTHGDAVALGLVAALRLSGQPTDVVEEVLHPRRIRADRERAWAALKRDKKATGGQIRLVLLRAPGEPVYGVEPPEADVRAALDELIAG
jgi:shikimate kinase / 3-dehydroquinate synthase